MKLSRLPPSAPNAGVLDKASALLRPDERLAPDSVLATADFFASRGLWFQLSRNPKVLSCRDAARRRNRLGFVGIPLADELRSYLAEGFDAEGRGAYVLLHCRGDASIDLDLVADIPLLGGLKLSRAQVHEFADETIGYGLINPFVAPRLLSSRATVIQVFDPSILDGSGETKTMMTNAGDKTWAVEFDPRELIKSLGPDFGLVEKITPLNYHRHSEDTKVIGILTGNAPESGALLWRRINRHFREQRGQAFRGDISYPRTIVHSQPAMGWSMELAERNPLLLPVVTDEVRAMQRSGAQVVALACNTTQFYEEELSAAMSAQGGRYVSLAKAVSRWIEQNRSASIFVAGIGHVTGEKKWSAFPFLFGQQNVSLPNKTQLRLIEELAYDVKQAGVSSRCYQKFRRLFHSVTASKTLLLLTELSMIYEAYPRPTVGLTELVDGIDLYARAILDSAAVS